MAHSAIKPLFTQVDMLTEITPHSGVRKMSRVIRQHERDFPNANVWCAVTAADVIAPYYFDTPNSDVRRLLTDGAADAIDELPL